MLSFSATGLPPGLSIDPVTGIISGTIDRSASQGGTNGVYTVIVTATDPVGGTANLTFTWTALNPPPVAERDEGTTEENTLLEVTKDKGLLSNDNDPDGDDLVVTDIENEDGIRVSVGTPIAGSNGGTLTVNPDGSYSFNPGTDFDYLADGESTTVTFTYTISDGEGGTDTAQLVITVTGSNDAPVIVGADDSATITELPETHPNEENYEHVQTGEVRFSDVDAGVISSATHTPTVTPSTSNATSYGTLTASVTADGVVTWTFTVQDADINSLAEGQKEVQTYTITITDEHGATAEQQVTITIEGTNDAPTITSDAPEHAGSVVEDATEVTTTGQLAYNDDDNNVHDSQTWSLIGDDGEPTKPDTSDVHTVQGIYGYLELGTDGKWTYHLDNDRAATNALQQGETATETFTARVTDKPGAFAEQDIVITVTGSSAGATITPDDSNGSAQGHITVNEKGLTGDDTSHITNGSIKVSADDGLASITIGGQEFTLDELLALSSTSASDKIYVGHGTITLTGFAGGYLVDG